ncbi:MAG: hypothetical protein NWE99_02300 [Candidatus Bathyarchaeota archaeon]|nr:hypothetical protein [Candidatus Bathyarchaeota archaeon]
MKNEKEVLLAEFLMDFDSKDKLKIAKLMAREFGLEVNGEKFSTQLQRKLNRELTEQEAFQVDALQRALSLDPTKMFTAG